ncbi:hypothetical protein ACERJO_20180 [Halalkalibacter sp. AB-rgal2]|uniref:hypothetical protein n=1 Tax=Halalkalibacter sp. AB-rgal2 TaxID=3242695 RepID=UPI00359E9F62
MMQQSKENLERKLQYYKETLQSLKAGTVVDDYLLLKEELLTIRKNQKQNLNRMKQLEEIVNNYGRDNENVTQQLFKQAIEKMEKEFELKAENDTYMELLKRVNEMEETVHDRLSNQERQLKNVEDKLERMDAYVEKQNELAEKVESDEFTQTIAKRSSSDYKKLQQLISSSGQQEDQQPKMKWSAHSPVNKPLDSIKSNEKTAHQSYFPTNSKGFQKPRDTKKK